MHPHADSPSRSSEPLRTALLDYAKAPGKYHVALRQPPLLFASIREILQLAVNREQDAGPVADPEKTALRTAARFFTRTALLFPGADHYDVLGLDRNFEAAELKDRYRLLMRLTHPDFSSATSRSWPADAAVRVNLAYEVLSSSVRRRDYETRIAATGAQSRDLKVAHRRINNAVRNPAKEISRSRLKLLAIACSVAAAFFVTLSLVLGGSDAVHLVQRVRPPIIESVVAAAQEAPVTAAAPPLPTRIAEPSSHAPPAPAATLTPAPAPSPVFLPVHVDRVEPPSPAPSPERTPEVQVSPVPVVVAVSVPAPPSPRSDPPPPRSAPFAGVSLAEAQPLLTLLLQHLESGRGERLINMLDREARSKSGAQALSRQYDVLVDGMRPVRLSHAEFKAEPADGRLLVTGNIRLQVGEQTIGSQGKKIALRAEFVSRDGTVVMTGLSGMPSD